MLEIKNLTKTYRSKTGDQVRALDDISISFPESGMIFILGKSGSGKSTLLNVMGGLDSYDSGEFIIKGKSSKNFGGSDFDAYRNTFIGFIFQEYNVLDDFTVGANIGLALELQGKKATAEKINKILAQVDLVNYAKRKPNELSGGQKQRVAIARALVKEPQIIMADEPTGALDSNTGKQIFDTLKALSREKLVLVVSHDRDFAERYADRIIELSDGHIISDVTKHEHQSEHLSEGVDRINHNIFRIKGGYRLTAADLEMINAYLEKSASDVLLSGDGRVNDELRSAVGISEKGTTAVFEGTNAEVDYTLKQYEKKDSKFIRSRLPMKNAVRIGSSGLKHKRFRLVMTIFLSLIAFALFGFADTAAGYDKITATLESIMDSNVKNASMTVGVRHTTTYDDGDSYTYYQEALLNDDDIEWIRNQTGMDFVPVYTGSRYAYDGGFSMSSMMKQYESNTLYNAQMAGLVAMNGESLARTGFSITGRLPQAEGEIAITEFMYRQFNEYGFSNTAHQETVEAGQLTMLEGDKNSIIGKHLTLNGNGGWMDSFGTGTENDPNTFVIVGVIDTRFDYDRYASFMPQDENAGPVVQEENELTQMVLMRELSSDLQYGFHALGFVSRTSIDRLSASNMMISQELGTSMNGWGQEMYVAVKRTENGEDASADSMPEGDKPMTDIYYEGERIQSVAGSAALAKLKMTWLDGKERTTLAPNEIVVPSNLILGSLPDSVQASFPHEAFATKVKSLYGEKNWRKNQQDTSYRERLYYAATTSYINKTVNTWGPDVVNAVFENLYGSTGDTNLDIRMEYIKDEWKQKWNSGETWWTPGDIVNGASLSYYEVCSQAERDVFETLLGVYGITLPSTMKNNQKKELFDLMGYQMTSLLDCSESAPSFSVDKWRIIEILRSVESFRVVYDSTLWTNRSFVDLMLAQDNGNYLPQDDWDRADVAERKSRTISFYRDYYLTNSTLGYETNSYGESGKEIETRADALFRTVAGIDEQTIASLIDLELMVHNYENGNTTSKGVLDYEIVGYYDTNSYGYQWMIVSDSLKETYQTWHAEVSDDYGYHEDVAQHEDGQWAFVIAPMTTDENTLLKLVQMSYDETGDLQFEMQNSVMNTLGTFNEFIEVGAKIFLYVGIGFAVFSALLLMNFIATSISYKKREIGVLRAVGARSSDVFKIFFSEALIIALINFALSMAAVITGIYFVNDWMRDSGIQVTLLTFGTRQFILMLAVSVGVALLASFLPVYNIAKRKPIDAIRDK